LKDVLDGGPGWVLYSPAETPVPESSTWAMMLVGFAGLGFAGYRRSRRAGPAGTTSLRNGGAPDDSSIASSLRISQ
jgi:hypothetical protein